MSELQILFVPEDHGRLVAGTVRDGPAMRYQALTVIL